MIQAIQLWWVTNEKLLGLQGWMSQLAFSRHWNYKEAGCSTNEGMDLLARGEQEGKERKLLFFSLFVCFSMSLYRLPAEGVA